MIPSLFVSLLYGETDTTIAFLQTILPMVIIGGLIACFVRTETNKMKIRDGIAIVSLCWILSSFLGAIPFIVSGEIPNFSEAFFEASSGFTTTGSSILTDVEAMSKGMLFWRSFTHWLGGMGILVFAIAILPALGINGNKIAQVETTGPTMDKISSKMHDTAKILYKMYFSFTVVMLLLLLLGDMNLFDALLNTFGSMGTGGFSNYNVSIGHFDSAYLQIVITTFMILAGTNFTLYYYLFKGYVSDFVKDAELRIYLLIFVGFSLLIAANLWFTNTYDSLGRTFLASFFQSASIMTTTGFATEDYDLWPMFSKTLLLLLMFIGGCSSSTAGGIKVIRIIVLIKMIKRGIVMRLHPQAIVSIKINKKALPADTASGIAGFFFLYMGLFVVGTILVSLENYDLTTCFSAVAACLGNIGPGFALVGPTMNFSLFSDPTTLLLSFLMIAGRLELFTLILLFSPQFWSQDK